MKAAKQQNHPDPKQKAGNRYLLQVFLHLQKEIYPLHYLRTFLHLQALLFPQTLEILPADFLGENKRCIFREQGGGVVYMVGHFLTS